MTTFQRPRQTFWRVDTPARRPEYRPGNGPPPRELFEGHPEVQEAIDRWTHMEEVIRHHSTAAAQCRQAAPQAERDYRAEFGQALAEGRDTSKIVNRKEELLAQAEEHDRMYAETRHAAVAFGPKLGALVWSAADDPALLAAAEARARQAAERLTVALTTINDAEREWSAAFGARMTLGKLALFGGATPIRPSASTPVDRMYRLANAAAEIDALLSDEANVRKFRGEAVEG